MDGPATSGPVALSPATEAPVQIACRDLWKLFGPAPRSFLDHHGGNPSAEACAAAGYVPAVRGVSFEVRKGQILVVMGLSGSGKSTLVRCLSRLVEPTAGQVLFEGRDLLQASPAELIDLRRHRMGMVFQHFGLLPHRTVLQNVAFPLEVQGQSRREREDRARAMIALVGLEGRESYFPRELSGGQQQRVGIARSLAVEPEVWFLDEPFSALDPLIRREMQDEFLRLQRSLHKTIVFITHDFAEAVRLADRIGIMKDGVLVQIGTAEELVLDPADDYVAAFVKEAPKGKLVRAASIASPIDGGRVAAYTVQADDRLDTIASAVLGQDLPVPVLGADGAALGAVDRQRLIDLLFERRA